MLVGWRKKFEMEKQDGGQQMMKACRIRQGGVESPQLDLVCCSVFVCVCVLLWVIMKCPTKHYTTHTNLTRVQRLGGKGYVWGIWRERI